MRWRSSSCYSNKIESVTLRKCPLDRRLASKAYLSAVTVTIVSRSFCVQDGDKNQLRTDTEQDYVTVTVSIPVYYHIFLE